MRDAPDADAPRPPPPGARRSTQRGASLVEAALLVALIAVVAIPAVTLFQQEVSALLCKASEGRYNRATGACERPNASLGGL